jgi:uncharacterized membrane protein YdjX (TVP38/TMEM64 family)
VKFDLDEEEETESNKYGAMDYLKLAAVLVGVALVAYFLYRVLGHGFFEFALHALRKLVEDDSLFSYTILILCQFIFAGVLFFPGLSTFDILQAFLMKSFTKSLIISLLGVYLGSVLVVYVIKRYFRQQIIERFRKKILFRIVYVEVKKNPWKFGFIFNMLFIPASVKNYLMALTSITMYQYAIVILPAHLFYCFMFSLVGYSMTDLNAMFHDRPFSQKTTAEKLQSVFTYVLLAATVSLFVLFLIIAKRKYKEIENEHRMQSVIAKSQMLEMQIAKQADRESNV